MSGDIDKLVSVAASELRRQMDVSGGYFVEHSEGSVSLDGAVDVPPLVRAILLALREPSDAMLRAADPEIRDHPSLTGLLKLRSIWTAMIDAILKE